MIVLLLAQSSNVKTRPGSHVLFTGVWGGHSVTHVDMQGLPVTESSTGCQLSVN